MTTEAMSTSTADRGTGIAHSLRLPVRAMLVHGLMVLLVLVAIFPVYWMVATSLKPDNEIFSTKLWPSEPSLDNYRFVLGSIPMLRMIFNSTVVSLATAALQVFTGLLAAYALVKWQFRLSGFVYGAITLSWLVPFQVTMIPNYVLAARLGMLDTIPGLVIPHIASALAVMMLFHAMKSFPAEVLESARLDGAKHWGILWQIVVPNMKASLASIGILSFISAWNEYFWPLLLSRSLENSVVQIGLQMFMTQEGNLWGPLMAASTMASLPILAIYLVMQRQVVQSFMQSGLR